MNIQCVKPLAALCVSIFASSASVADALPEVATGALKSEVKRKELINGQWKYYVSVGINQPELDARNYKLNRPEAADSWFLQRSRSDQPQGVRFHPDRVEILRLRNGVPLTAFLIFNSHVPEFKKKDKVTPYISGRRSPVAQNGKDEPVLFHPERAAEYSENAISPFSYSVNGGYAPSQEMESGVYRSAFHVPLKARLDPILTGQNLGEFYLESNNLLSSESDDRSSQLEFGLGFLRRATLVESNHFLSLQGGLSYVSNQSFRSQAVRITFGGDTDLGVPGLKFGSVAQSPFGPLLHFSPINYEHRLRRDLDIPSISSSELYYMSADVSWRPIYLFASHKTPSLDRNVSLVVDLKGYWFPSFQTSGGYDVQHFEGYASIRLNIPLRTPVLKSRLFFGYASGVNEADQFARSSSVTVGIEILGSDFKLLGL